MSRNVIAEELLLGTMVYRGGLSETWTLTDGPRFFTIHVFFNEPIGENTCLYMNVGADEEVDLSFSSDHPPNDPRYNRSSDDPLVQRGWALHDALIERARRNVIAP